LSTAYQINSYSKAMFKKLFLLGMLLPATSFSTPSVEVLFNTNPSVVKVHVANDKGNHGVGSGVVVAKNYIVTNCHVIANSQGIHVTKYGISYSPDALIADWKSDLCILKFKFLELKPVKMTKTADVEYETDVFTKSYGGNSARPGSSFGTVKAKFHFDGHQIIQSSASFMLGASGGGIFNYQGELLGITTFKTPGRSAFYYSMPVEIIEEMLTKGEEVSITTAPERAFWDQPEEDQPYFMRVVSALNKKDWNRLKIISEDWVKSEPEADESNFHLGLANYHKKIRTMLINYSKKLSVKIKNIHYLIYICIKLLKQITIKLKWLNTKKMLNSLIQI